MKSPRQIARYLFTLILTVSLLLSGFMPSGYSSSRHFVSTSPPAAQDGEASWTPVNTGLSSTNIAALAIDPVNTATIYAGTRGGGMFKSIDGGQTGAPSTMACQTFQGLAPSSLTVTIQARSI
ncbi:MAG: WD40/YVTN/BNR-like repeat-containing protein [Pyrinomonadaceae bacterium]